MKRSKVSLSHYKLLTGDMGELIPIGLTEVLPGDTIQQATSALLRVSPLLAPVMHPVQVRIHHWFVPHRLVWEDFEKFITGGEDGMDTSELPKITFNPAPAIGTLADYLGLPAADLPTTIPVNALPFRGYSLIWNEFYRDQDLQTKLTIDLTSGADTTTNTDLQNICWEKDYFTTSRPWTQKGAEAQMPLGTDAPVLGLGVADPATGGWIRDVTVRESDGTASTYDDGLLVNADNAAEYLYVEQDGTSGYPHIRADLTQAGMVTVNQLREAFALQRYAEARARYGSRYTEYLRYLGIRSADGRLDRPEYLGGGKQTIQFSEVLQTGTGGDGVGTMFGHGIGALRSNRYRRFFDEHGYIYTMISVRPKTIYAQGIQKHWTRSVKEDFYQRELERIGQAEVYNQEIYAAHASPDGVFGYQDRYDEYRRTESGIAGEFRDTLDHWHMARLFASDPALNADFVKAVPTKRIHAVSNADVLWIMANNSIQARRMIGG